jgi:DNA invertase Pin-like site-specific DNA recombinase
VKLIPYPRVSTDRQADDGTGLELQLDTIRQWAKANGHTLTKPLREEGVSGTKELEHRPALVEAMEMLKAGKADGIVVYRLDRLARDLILQEQLLREIRRMGADVYTTSTAEAGYLADDPNDPARRLIRQVLGAVGEYERSMIALRLRSARERKALNGGYAGFGSPAFGYRSEAGELVRADDEQRAIKRITALRAAGASLPAIAEALAAEGITSKRGGRWHPTTIARVLQRSEGSLGG